MSLNEEYAKAQQQGVEQLVEHANYHKATNHVTFDASKTTVPEGITEESLKNHVEFINNISGQVEVATAQIARREYESNDKLTTVDGTWEFGGVTVNSQHHLKQQVGEDWIFGVGTTAVDYAQSQDLAVWLDDQRQSNVDLATKLFG